MCDRTEFDSIGQLDYTQVGIIIVCHWKNITNDGGCPSPCLVRLRNGLQMPYTWVTVNRESKWPLSLLVTKSPLINQKNRINYLSNIFKRWPSKVLNEHLFRHSRTSCRSEWVWRYWYCDAMPMVWCSCRNRCHCPIKNHMRLTNWIVFNKTLSRSNFHR